MGLTEVFSSLPAEYFSQSHNDPTGRSCVPRPAWRRLTGYVPRTRADDEARFAPACAGFFRQGAGDRLAAGSLPLPGDQERFGRRIAVVAERQSQRSPAAGGVEYRDASAGARGYKKVNGLPLLHIRLSIDYPGKPRVLDDAMLDVRPGEIVGLVGESGSGKSSLALALLRLLDLKGGRASGNIWFNGRDLMRCGERELRSIRGKEIAFVPQSPSSYLNPALRLGDQMAEAWRAHRKGSRADVERDVRRAIEQVGLPADGAFLRRYSGEVSVGQAQRVLIAMAALHYPGLLIADEPTSSLDLISQAEVLRLLSRLNRELGMGVLYISHDLMSIAGFCDRVAILHEGRIVEFAETDAVFERPEHPYTQALIGALPGRVMTGDMR